MIIIIGKKDRELIEFLRNHIISYINTHTIRRCVRVKYNKCIDKLGKTLHIKN